MIVAFDNRRPSSIQAQAFLPEGQAAVLALSSELSGEPRVYLEVMFSVRKPNVCLYITPEDALHLARRLIRCVEEGRSAGG